MHATNDPATRIDAIAALLHDAGEIHHGYFADTDGTDDDWATFYSDWLLAHTPLAEHLGRRPIRSHLTRDLVVCDEAYTRAAPATPWPRWYAERLFQNDPAGNAERTG